MEVADPFRDPTLYTYEPIPLIKRFKKLFRRMDIYALPITFRYMGEKKFYTNFGALNSIFIVLLVLAYSYTEVSLMLDKRKYTTTSTTSSTLQRDLQTGEFAYDTLLSKGEYANLTFGIKVMNDNGSAFFDPSYF